MTLEKATELARPYMKHDTVIVFSDGVINVDGDIEKALSHATEQKIEAFIIKPKQVIQPDKKKK